MPITTALWSLRNERRCSNSWLPGFINPRFDEDAMQQKTTLLLPLLLGALVTAAAAETPAEVGPGIGQKMKENAEELRQYSFKRRTEITIKGQSRGPRVDQVRY